MSFRINTNVQAMGALRNLGNTGIEASKSMTRLSTGLRITSAADDPAGLIVSDQFKAQIGGLDQAVRNNQDAGNYAKTAEGALNEVNKLLGDARTLAVASGNGATLTDAQRQANQQQLNSIMDSINRIAGSTGYGTKKLLNGSSGITATSLDASNALGANFSGTFNSEAVTGGGAVTVTVTTAAERASITSTATFAATTTTVSAGTFTINGTSFTTASTDTVADVLSKINNSSSTTGVSASFESNALVLTSKEFGADAAVNLVDSAGVLLGSAGQASDTGVDAVATVSVDVNGSATGGVNSVTFNQGKGLVLRDNSGNRVSLTEAGNATTAATAMIQLVSNGSTSFQIGGNAGDTANLSLGNFAASGLGLGAVSGKDLSNIDVLDDASAGDALKVIDQAISDVSESRGRIGNFIRNTIETNVRSLGVQKENLAATLSSITDVDVAEEMTNFTKLQILQQSGMSMLAQANSAPQSVLSLLR